MNPFSPQGGKCAFWGWLKWPYLGFGVSEEVKFFLLWTLDPLGPTWGAARAEKYLHPSGTPLKLVVPKMAKNQHFGSEGMAPPDGPKYFSVRIRSRNVLSGPSLIKWGYKHFHSPSRTDSMVRWKLLADGICPKMDLRVLPSKNTRLWREGT